MYLDNKLFALLVFAIKVVNGAAVGFGTAEMFVLEVSQSFDAALFFFEELIEEVDQQIFVVFFTEQLFEAEVGERIQICRRLY